MHKPSYFFYLHTLWDTSQKTKQLNMTLFNTAANSLNYHLETVLNFFKNRHTNANAESFNSKIKLFRANQRGVVDVKFFLFRRHYPKKCVSLKIMGFDFLIKVEPFFQI